MNELEGHSRRGMAPHDAWNQSAVQLIKAAQAHSRYLVAECFVRSVKEGKFSGPVRSILNELCEFLLIYWVVERSGDFFMVSSTFLRSTSLPLTMVLYLNWYSSPILVRNNCSSFSPSTWSYLELFVLTL